jgi:radical SAM protein with 4Fe4S-binding SPASM domain
MNRLLVDKVRRALTRRLDAAFGRLFFDLEDTLAAMATRPFELHLELTNLCNADCIFCPYHFQQRSHQFMSDEVFHRAVDDFVGMHGGSVGLTPIVGDALIDPHFLARVRALRARSEIDRIFVTTNAILLDRHGIAEVLSSGVTSINISTSGFDELSYRRIYRSSAYRRMRDNVTALVEENARLAKPVNVTIGLRTDRPLEEVLKDPDFQPILRHEPNLDFTWWYSSAGGRITRETLPAGMTLRKAPPKTEPCVNLYNGPIVLPDGTVLGCSCLAAMDALEDLKIGHILEENLLEIWTGELMRQIRAQFRTQGCLNQTCEACEMYHDLELYRTAEGRRRARLNRLRQDGSVRRGDREHGIFAGG